MATKDFFVTERSSLMPWIVLSCDFEMVSKRVLDNFAWDRFNVSVVTRSGGKEKHAIFEYDSKKSSVAICRTLYCIQFDQESCILPMQQSTLAFICKPKESIGPFSKTLEQNLHGCIRVDHDRSLCAGETKSSSMFKKVSVSVRPNL